jgi:hypothetical protein
MTAQKRKNNKKWLWWGGGDFDFGGSDWGRGFGLAEK